MRNKRFFEIGTAVWALALVVLGAVHLTAGDAYAGRGWFDCGEACANYCDMAESSCSGVFEWYGCGCTVYCEDGTEAPVYCF